MTAKTFAELYDAPTGTFVADMHDGLSPVAARFTIIHTIKWRLIRGEQAPGTFRFPNKDLRTLGEGIGREPTLVCGYTYDNETAGIVVLAEKGTT